MAESVSQRDRFFDRLYEIARQDRDVVLVSADMGAPALDRFRRDLPGQFVNVGIAEQNAVLLASGLALRGKKAFAYAIAPFITLRCLEQARVELAMMNLPVTLVGVGAGFGYEDSGPTHHLLEDLAILRALPNLTIHSVTDGRMAEALPDRLCAAPSPSYVRLERAALPDVYPAGKDFGAGLAALRKGSDVLLLSTGAMTHTALAVADRLAAEGLSVGVADLYRLPIPAAPFLKLVKGAKRLVTLEEHFLPGGLGSAVCELLADRGIFLPIRRLGLSPEKGYCYRYGGREALRERYGLDQASVARAVAAFARS